MNRTIRPNGEAIRYMREDRGWTRDHLREASEVDIRTIARIEEGRPVFPSTLRKLADAFKEDLAALVAPRESELEAASEATNSSFGAALQRLAAVVQHLQMTISNLGNLEIPNPVDFVAHSLLPQIQSLLEAYADGPVVCSLKVQSDEGHLRCIYPANNPTPDLAATISHVSRTRSYSGMALRQNKPLIIPDLSQEQKAMPLHRSLCAAMEKCHIRGVVACPIQLRSADTAPVPVAVLKVDLLREHAIKENETTRLLLDLVTGQVSLAFQICDTLARHGNAALTEVEPSDSNAVLEGNHQWE